MGGPFVRPSRRRWSAVLGVVALLSVAAAQVSAEEPLDDVLGDPGITYPDLRPNTKNFWVNTFAGPPVIEFDTLSANLGSVPLQVTAQPSDDPLNPNVSQCVSWYDDHVCRAQEPVGGFTWHDEHTHFHFEDFATYSLRRVLPDGTPDYSSAGLISVSEKVSFCLIDIEQYDTDKASPTPFYTLANCYAPVVMGISPGWADNYDASLDGQELSLTGVTDGTYALIIDQDPANRLYETDDTNNRVVATFNLTGMGTAFPQAVITDRQWPAVGGGGGT
nr:lysyl oxidase family protein [Actinomycetota bacterium]